MIKSDEILSHRTPGSVGFINYWYDAEETGTDGKSRLEIKHTQLQLFAMHSPDKFMDAYETILEALNKAEVLAKRTLAERSTT